VLTQINQEHGSVVKSQMPPATFRETCNMNPTLIGRHPRMPLVWSAVGRTARLSIFGFVGWFWFISGNDSTGRAVSLVAALVLAALAGVTWYASRARTDRRWRAVLDRYATRELMKRTGSGRGPRSRPNSTVG
jgi:hypothetical protein